MSRKLSVQWREGPFGQASLHFETGPCPKSACRRKQKAQRGATLAGRGESPPCGGAEMGFTKIPPCSVSFISAPRAPRQAMVAAMSFEIPSQKISVSSSPRARADKQPVCLGLGGGNADGAASGAGNNFLYHFTPPSRSQSLISETGTGITQLRPIRSGTTRLMVAPASFLSARTARAISSRG